eukprot:s4487_g4.t1
MPSLPATWLLAEFSLQLVQVLTCATTASTALRAFGLHLYAAGLPRYLLVYAITAAQDLRPQMRGSLTGAWQIDKKWQLAEPGSCRPVISAPILQAAVALAILWSWLDWAAITMLGFICVLHPTEFESARQHGMEDEATLFFLEALYGNLPLDELLFRGSLHTYRRQWDAVMSRLGVPHRLSDHGATPGVLRGSGATYLYLECEDVQLVAWRGRWAKMKTVEFYLQEVAANLLLQQLSESARARISVLRSFEQSTAWLSKKARGDFWRTRDNWNGELDPCWDYWYGVTCNEHGYVIKLELSDNRVRGPLPSALGALTSLIKLDLSSTEPEYHMHPNDEVNRVEGSMPSLAMCFQLEEIEVSGNLILKLPDDLYLNADTLRSLSASRNQLRNMPNYLRRFQVLHTLELDNNMIEEGLSVLPKFSFACSTLKYAHAFIVNAFYA